MTLKVFFVAPPLWPTTSSEPGKPREAWTVMSSSRDYVENKTLLVRVDVGGVNDDAPLTLKRIKRRYLPRVGGLMDSTGIGLTLEDAFRVAETEFKRRLIEAEKKLETAKKQVEALDQFAREKGWRP